MSKVFSFNDTNDYAEYVLDKANIFLDWCEIYGPREEREGLIKDIEMSIEAKQWLFEIFSRCEGWNGKGQVVLPVSFERPISESEIDRFSEFLRYYQRNMLEEIVVEESGYKGTYRELKKIRSTYEDYKLYTGYINVDPAEISIKGKSIPQYKFEISVLTDIISGFRRRTDCKLIGSKYVTKESAEEYKTAKKVRDIILSNDNQFITDEGVIQDIRDTFGVRVSSGVKTTRAVLKILKVTKLYKEIVKDEDGEREFNRAYSRYCDAVNPLSIKKWTVISVNFVDYLTMSYGKGWTSCLNPDKRQRITAGMWANGCNSRRVLDYALDPSTIVFYTIDSDYDGDDFELQPKETRQLFHFNGSRLIQSRLYPQGDDSRAHMYPQYREIIERILCEGMDVPNLWSAPTKGTISEYDGIAHVAYDYSDYGDYIDFFSFACHGFEENEFQDHVNYVTLKGTYGDSIEIGSMRAVDIITGKERSQSYTEAITRDYR